MPSIATLPNELIAFVLENLRSQRDIASLCKVNRKLYEAVTPVLYKNAVDRRDMWPLAFAAFSGRASTMRKILAAGASPDWLFDSTNMPPEARALIMPDLDRIPQPQNTPFGRAQPSQPHMDYRQAELFHGHDPWSSTSSDSYDDDLEGDEYPIGGSLDVWATWTDQPLAHDESLTSAELDGVDDDMSEQSSMNDDSSADSSTLGYSDRQRDGAARDHDSHIPRFFGPLHIAAGMGNNEVIKVLLDYGASIDIGSQLLCGCKSAVGMLNNMESPETEICLPLWTPLHVAICHNRPDTAMLLLSRGAQCMMECSYETGVPEQVGSTALHHAAALGQAELVKYIVDNGHQTDIDVQDRRTLTPFYYAYANACWGSTIPLLLQMGADINVEIKFYQPYCTITPLGEAVRLGNFDDAQKLIDLGADPSHGFVATGAGHRKGLSPLHLGCMPSACRSGAPKLFEDTRKGSQRMKIMETFIAKGSDIHSTDCYGDTPLISAAQNRVLPSLRALIAAGADVNARNSLGRTVVMQAVLGPPNPLPGSLDDPVTRTSDTLRVLSSILSELLGAGARIEDVDPSGNNVLHLFLESSKAFDPTFVVDIMRLVLSYPGADALVSAKNKEGRLAFEVAFYADAVEACELLLRRGSVQRVLTSDDRQRMFKFTMQKGNVYPRNLDLLLDLDFARELLSNAELFREALTNGAWSVVSVMACRGLPPVDPETCTRLLSRVLNACEWDIAYQLIERGADVNTAGKDGTQAPLNLVSEQLHNVDYYRIERLLQILIDKGANIHYSPCGASRSRPLTRAIDERCVSLVEVMLRDQPLRNDPRAVGGYYLHRALHLAHSATPYKRAPHPRIIYALIHSGADLTELDQHGDYPLAVLVRGLYSLAAVAPAQDFQFFQYSDLLKELFAPGVQITRPNKQGFSIANYLEELLETKAGRLWVAPKLELVEDASGTKTLRFLPDMRLKRMPEYRPVTTIWDTRLLRVPEGSAAFF
ncbi:ankyrin [Coniochaeta sp. PMI_546]|nr:ankyrin [Coniochaeta sp. PMI_546]